MSAPEHAWFLPGLSIEHAADEAERLELFDALNRAGRLEAFLYDAEPGRGGLLNAWKALTGDGWVFALRYGPVETASRELCAVVVLTGFTGKAAFFHFCLLPGFERHWLPMGRDIIAWLFESRRIACLLGFTPVCYRHVRAALPGFGFVPRFTAPEACLIRRRHRYADGVISMCTKESFEEALKGEGKFSGGGTLLEKGLRAGVPRPRTPTPKNL